VFERIALALRHHVAVQRAVGRSAAGTPAATAGARSHHAAGIRAMEEGNVGQAIDCFRKAVEEDPELGVAYHDLGVAYARQKRLPPAIACFQRHLQQLELAAGPREPRPCLP